jgi:hypothetical protein
MHLLSIAVPFKFIPNFQLALFITHTAVRPCPEAGYSASLKEIVPSGNLILQFLGQKFIQFF